MQERIYLCAVHPGRRCQRRPEINRISYHQQGLAQPNAHRDQSCAVAVSHLYRTSIRSRLPWRADRTADLFRHVNIKAIRTLICCLPRISTLIASPSTTPVMRPWIHTCSRPKVYLTGVDASWPRTPRATAV